MVNTILNTYIVPLLPLHCQRRLSSSFLQPFYYFQISLSRILRAFIHEKITVFFDTCQDDFYVYPIRLSSKLLFTKYHLKKNTLGTTASKQETPPLSDTRALLDILTLRGFLSFALFNSIKILRNFLSSTYFPRFPSIYRYVTQFIIRHSLIDSRIYFNSFLNPYYSNSTSLDQYNTKLTQENFMTNLRVFLDGKTMILSACIKCQAILLIHPSARANIYSYKTTI